MTARPTTHLRLDLAVPGGLDSDWSIFLRDGRWWRQRFVRDEPPGVREGAFFHFQVTAGTAVTLRAPSFFLRSLSHCVRSSSNRCHRCHRCHRCK